MDLTPEFNSAAGGSEGGAGPIDRGPNPTGPASPSVSGDIVLTEAHLELTPQLTLEEALAELEILEKGRATPAPRLNNDPPKHLKTPVDSQVERNREARASALKAYLQFHDHEPDPEPNHDQGEDLEFSI
jgi:hypothetical protein